MVEYPDTTVCDSATLLDELKVMAAAREELRSASYTMHRVEFAAWLSIKDRGTSVHGKYSVRGGSSDLVVLQLTGE